MWRRCKGNRGRGPAGADLRFLVDAMLGHVARDLRLLGYDAAYGGASRDAELLGRCRREGRILITRDRELARRAAGVSCVLVAETRAPAQSREVIRSLGLADAPTPLTRCLRCNGRLRPASPEEVRPSLPDHVAATHTHFLACRSCGRVYWEGSHGRGLRARIARLQGSR
ncbi:MAG: Mut7-C RNAse domain-containing protein [Deferrisomatales bacterium]|nr:Mut7-C RNAse domain-containing protein [Deferrisomatales bacterium]